MRVLIVDDDETHNQKMAEAFQGDQVVSAFNLQEAVKRLEEWPDLVVLDAVFPEDAHTQSESFMADKFLNRLERLSDQRNQLRPTVILVSSEVRAAKKLEEIVDWLTDNRIHWILAKSLAGPGWEFFQAILRHAADTCKKIQRLYPEDSDLEDIYSSLARLEPPIITCEPSMAAIWNKIYKAARTDKPVFIQGEAGTGKELVARAIHYLSCFDARTQTHIEKPFLAWLCVGGDGDLIASALFGHVKGAFTGAISDKTGFFEEASGGTLLINEVGDLPLDTQPKLLRVLQEKEIVKVGSTTPRKISTRVIADTNKKLEELIRDGKFRGDLSERLNVLRITVPPLRERRRDIPLLTNHFLKRENKKLENNVSIANELRRAMECGPWMGNIRQLEHFMERIVTNCTGIVSLKEVKELFSETELLDRLGSSSLETLTLSIPEDSDEMIMQLSSEIEYPPRITWESLGVDESKDASNEELVLRLLKQFMIDACKGWLENLQTTLKARLNNDPRRIHHYLALLYLVLRQDHEATISDFKSILTVKSWEYRNDIGKTLTDIKNDNQEQLVSLQIVGKKGKKVFSLSSECLLTPSNRQ